MLIVEDNADSREMLAQLLRMDGCHVTVAADGNQGLEAIRREKFDLALVDIGLPGIDGYEVARQVRAGSGGDGIYFVALTGYGRPEDRLACSRRDSTNIWSSPSNRATWIEFFSPPKRNR